MAYTTIKKPSDYFNTKLYTGNASTQSITGVGFQPDFTWIKNRDSVTGHRIIDAVRGNTKTIYTNATQGEETVSNMMTSFDSDGFSLGNDGGVNGNGNGIASWNWKANGAGSANTDGSINSTVSVNTTAGFSIVSYTGTGSAGATVGHGLGTTPSMIIVKNRSSSVNWSVYHKDAFTSQSAPGVLYLNTTAGKANDTNVWGNSTVTINNSVFSLGDYGGTNGSGNNLIAYCFADVQGYSKFGSYAANENTDGTFVYTGFKPAWILVKQSNLARDWFIFDSKRDTSNVVRKQLEANSAGVEDAYDNLDFLSNGFKIRTTSATLNDAGGTYIYMAFAEEPLVGDNPATAR